MILYQRFYPQQAKKQALQQQQANKPGAYQSQYQTGLNDLAGQIQNRDKFQYDVNADALYQQVAQNYLQQGQQAMMDTAAQAAALSGLEFASGIPGTLGGGCAMNAGAYGGQLSDVLVDAEVYLDGEIRTLTLDEMQMGYRTTLPLREGGIVLSARFA